MTKPVVFWFLWCLYSWINWETKGVPPMEPFLPRHYITKFILPLATMWIVYYEGNRNLRSMSIVILFFSFVYCICGLLLQKVERSEQELGNCLALNGTTLAFFGCFCYINKFINRTLLLLVLLISLASIAFVSTRKAFGGFSIILISLFFSQIDVRNPKTLFYAFFILVAGSVSLQYVIEHTSMGERFTIIEDQAYSYSIKIPSYLTFLGERAAHYVLGWETFVKNPITGIGLSNFQTVTGFYYQLHTEYMVQLCEGGLIGSFLWVLFMCGIIKSAWHAYRKRISPVAIICIGGVFSILLIDLTAWTYQGTNYFAVYGLILAYCKPIKARLSNSNQYGLIN